MTNWLREVFGINDRCEREAERAKLEREAAKIDFRMRLAVCGMKNKITTKAPPPPELVAK